MANDKASMTNSITVNYYQIWMTLIMRRRNPLHCHGDTCKGRVTTHEDGSCMMQPPTYLVTNEGAGRWAGEEEAELTLVMVSPDTRVMWDVTTENLENIIMTINLSGE